MARQRKKKLRYFPNITLAGFELWPKESNVYI